MADPIGVLVVLGGGWIKCDPLSFGDRTITAARGTAKSSHAAALKPLEPEYRVWARLLPGDDGRPEIAEVLLRARRRMTAEVVREVPLSRIEAICNSGKIRDKIISALDEAPPFDDVRTLESQAKQHVTTEKELSKPPRKLRKAQNERGRYPDEFYEALAVEYGRLALSHSGPARLIAKANDVPVSTVYRWLKEARRRGFSPPGRKGPNAKPAREE